MRRPGRSCPRSSTCPPTSEFPAGALDLPWKKKADSVVGTFARDHGAKVPGRLVGSAKSWLSHSGVDRKAKLLPFNAPEGVAKVSPVEASAAYLAHLRDAWNGSIGKAADDRLGKQEILLTVPASFDASARDLTIEAARSAGLVNVTLLEEPQAAFYAWLAAQGDDWRKSVKVGDLLLVCDVGGGTTDFTLIGVAGRDGDLELTRLAVGEHILLGGDNMDLALAYAVGANLPGGMDGAGRQPEDRADLRLPQREGGPVLRPLEEGRPGRRARPRLEGRRRLGQDGADPGDARCRLARRLLPQMCPDRSARPGPPRRPDGDRPPLRRRPGHHAAPGPVPQPPGGLDARRPRPRSTPRPSSSTAASSRPRPLRDRVVERPLRLGRAGPSRPWTRATSTWPSLEVRPITAWSGRARASASEAACPAPITSASRPPRRPSRA